MDPSEKHVTSTRGALASLASTDTQTLFYWDGRQKTYLVSSWNSAGTGAAQFIHLGQLKLLLRDYPQACLGLGEKSPLPKERQIYEVPGGRATQEPVYP